MKNNKTDEDGMKNHLLYFYVPNYLIMMTIIVVIQAMVHGLKRCMRWLCGDKEQLAIKENQMPEGYRENQMPKGYKGDE